MTVPVHVEATDAPMASDTGVTALSVATGADLVDASCELAHFRKMATLGELASGITHDFRNILQTILSTLELIESRANDPADVRRLAASAIRASERGNGLTKRLLAFSRRDASEIRPASLLPSLESATETLARTVGARINVRLEPTAADLWQAAIDPIELELALINLGINARDAMPDGGHVRLGACNITIPQNDRRAARLLGRYDGGDRRGPLLPLPAGDYVTITVSDTGTGMDQATLARAAEPFFTTKPIGRGTGLGLAMVHTLVTEGRGTLRLISGAGRGTTVELWLPRAVNDTVGVVSWRDKLVVRADPRSVPVAIHFLDQRRHGLPHQPRRHPTSPLDRFGGSQTMPPHPAALSTGRAGR